MLCAKCGHTNAEGSWFCSKCGTALAVSQGPVAAAASKTVAAPAPAEAFDEDLWRAAVGPRNTGYYLPRFAARHAEGTAARWHWPAFFITFYWLLYRKLWGWAALYFVLPYLVLLLVGSIAAAIGEAGTGFAGALWLAALAAYYLVPPLFANQLYFARCAKLIERQRQSTRSREQLLAQVEARGGTSAAAAIVLGLLVVIAVIGILAAIALPAYSDYTRRAKVADALVAARSVAGQVGAYYQSAGTLPAGLDKLPQQPPRHRYIGAMRLDPADGVLEVTIDFGSGGGRGGSVYLVPAKDADGRLVWTCRAAPEMQRAVPAGCRDK